MAIFSHNSNNLILSLKVVLISTAVLSMAVMLKISMPVVIDFALSEVPSIWSLVVSWLRPPYLYLVINCIIITIVASSRLQSKFDHDHSCPPPPESVLLVQPEPVKVPADVRTDYVAVYGGGVMKSELVEVTPVPQFEYGYEPKAVKVSDFDMCGNVDARVSEMTTTITVNASAVTNGGDDFVFSKSSWNALNKEPLEFSFPTEKPLVSARFGHRKVVKATPEGFSGGKTLRVSKTKRHDTLESTWKTITDGRPMPLTRHLKKSDTWEMHGRHHLGSGGEPQGSNQKIMTKYETFNDRSSSGNKPPLTRSTGSGKLRKDPSLSQDELNKRVEAFIKKFNEDMRLERQESLNQYMEMINRGAH